MPIPRLPASATGDEVAAALRDQGCAVVERLVPRALLDRVRDELQPHLDATEPGTDDFSGRRTRRTGALIARSPTCRELITHPLVLAAVGDVLRHATNVQLHLTQMIGVCPEELRVVRINARIDRIAEYRTFRRAVPVPPQDAPNDIGAPVYGADNRAFNRRDGWLRARRCGYGAHFRTHHWIPPVHRRCRVPQAEEQGEEEDRGAWRRRRPV